MVSRDPLDQSQCMKERPYARAATIHFLSNRYISRYKCHDTIHDTIHHNIQLTSDVMLLNCFEIFNFH